MKKLHLFDSKLRRKVPFEPMEEGKVKLYVCGPTVYDDAHLGHARSALVFDLLHRVLKANNYDVVMVKNFTDIDDKIIGKMEESNQTLEILTQHYIQSYKTEMGLLNILPNTYEPKATESLDAMRELIQKLLDKGVAYVIDDGIYFDTSKDNNYGTISNKVNDDNALSRLNTNTQKRNFKDFALWKFNTNKVSFDLKEGQGRPGWHCECSAMINEYLSNSDMEFGVDIHGGGADLLFPHHENEASQSRIAYNQELAKYWIHNGFVSINGEKMSKSLGNSFFLKDILKVYHGEVIRFYMLGTYYRAEISFNEEDLLASKKRLDKIYRLKKRVYEIERHGQQTSFGVKILEALNDDMNVAKVNAFIDEMIVDSNEKLDNNAKNKNLKKEIVQNIYYIITMLGVAFQDPYEYFQFGIDEKEKNEIELLLRKRKKAKEEKDFQLSDNIRDQLEKMGIILMDTPAKTLWERI